MLFYVYILKFIELYDFRAHKYYYIYLYHVFLQNFNYFIISIFNLFLLLSRCYYSNIKMYDKIPASSDHIIFNQYYII